MELLKGVTNMLILILPYGILINLIFLSFSEGKPENTGPTPDTRNSESSVSMKIRINIFK